MKGAERIMRGDMKVYLVYEKRPSSSYERVVKVFADRKAAVAYCSKRHKVTGCDYGVQMMHVVEGEDEKH